MTLFILLFAVILFCKGRTIPNKKTLAVYASVSILSIAVMLISVLTDLPYLAESLLGY